MSIPNWFLLQAPPNMDIDVREWKKLAWDRVKLLEQLPHNPSQVVRDYFPTYEENLEKKYEDYRLGAYLLRLVAATNSRLESWLIESEGDLFERLYFDRTESIDQKLEIFRQVFENENVLKYEEFKYKMDETKNEHLAELYNQYHSSRIPSKRDFLVCVYFTQVPWMVSNRKGYLRKGWVVSNEVSFRGVLKKAFEKKLEGEIAKAQELLGLREDIDNTVQELEQDLSKHVQIRSQFSGGELEGQDLFLHPEIFPPCMLRLYTEFEKTGRLVHVQRLQMGFFFKKIGMGVEEQLHYWYEKSVDNVGQSYTEFKRTSGYQIRHLYGLEGGKKDYNVPKCSTIATGYFCPFVHLAPSILLEFLKSNYYFQKKNTVPRDSYLNSVISQSSTNPTQACSSYFRLVYGKPFRYKIVHPLQWSRYAIKLEGLSSKETSSTVPSRENDAKIETKTDS
jgi:DNA primase large subunit